MARIVPIDVGGRLSVGDTNRRVSHAKIRGSSLSQQNVTGILRIHLEGYFFLVFNGSNEFFMDEFFLPANKWTEIYCFFCVFFVSFIGGLLIHKVKMAQTILFDVPNVKFSVWH